MGCKSQKKKKNYDDLLHFDQLLFPLYVYMYVCMDRSLDGTQMGLETKGKCIKRRKQSVFTKSKIVLFPCTVTPNYLCTHKPYYFTLPNSSNPESQKMAAFMHYLTIPLQITSVSPLTLKKIILLSHPSCLTVSISLDRVL